MCTLHPYHFKALDDLEDKHIEDNHTEKVLASRAMSILLIWLER